MRNQNDSTPSIVPYLKQNAISTDGANVERVTEDGTEYLVFPHVIAKEMVLNYPENERKEYLSEEQLRASVDMWDEIPLSFIHPQNASGSVQHPQSQEREVIGEARDPELLELLGENKLRVNSYVDIEKARKLGGIAGEVVRQLENGEELATSPGYFTVGDRKENGTFQGEEYDVVQGTIVPDHIALFPKELPLRARCTPADGCAAPRLNAMAVNRDEKGDGDGQSTSMTDEINDNAATTLGRLILNAAGIGGRTIPGGVEEPPEDCGCGCGGKAKKHNAGHSEGGDGDDDGGDDDEDDDDGEGGDGDDSSSSDGSGDGSGNTDAGGSDSPGTDSNMDYNIEQLAANSSFSKEVLESWDEDQLNALSETINMQKSSDDGGSDDSGTDTDSSGTDADGDDGGSDGGSDDPEQEVMTKQNYEELKGMVTDLKETFEQQQRKQERGSEDVRMVANAVDVDEEEVLSMNENVYKSLVEQHGKDEETGPEIKTNYAGVPGTVDRTPPDEQSKEELEEYPTGSRDVYTAGPADGGDN